MWKLCVHLEGGGVQALGGEPHSVCKIDGKRRGGRSCGGDICGGVCRSVVDRWAGSVRMTHSQRALYYHQHQSSETVWEQETSTAQWAAPTGPFPFTPSVLGISFGFLDSTEATAVFSLQLFTQFANVRAAAWRLIFMLFIEIVYRIISDVHSSKCRNRLRGKRLTLK